MSVQKLDEIILPNYTRKEEFVNSITHIIGAIIAFIILIVFIVLAFYNKNPIKISTSIIYAISMLLVFSISSIYHGLNKSNIKKIFRVIDHCDIYLLIAGTYTPILLISLRQIYPRLAWTIFALEWTIAIIGIILNSINLKKYSKVSFILYILMGWLIVLCYKQTLEAIGRGMLGIFIGGLFFTIGAIFYLFGHKKRYIHSVFHIFVLLGCIAQFIAILIHIIL